jgi:hypothetical protein
MLWRKRDGEGPTSWRSIRPAVFVLALCACHRPGVAVEDDAEENADADLPSSDCPGYAHAERCYQALPLEIFTISPPLMRVLRLGGQMKIVSCLNSLLALGEYHNEGFQVENYPTEAMFPIASGDFAGDGVERLVLATYEGMEIQALSAGQPTGEILNIEIAENYWNPLSGVDLQDGSSLLVAQAGWGQFATFRLDVQSLEWVVMGPLISGPSLALDSITFDVDEDGYGDVVVWGTPDEGQDVYLFLNEGDGTLTPANIGNVCALGDAGRIFAGDLTGDGLADLACLGLSSGDRVIRVIPNAGAGLFADPIDIYSLPQGRTFSGIGDVEGDGFLDLVMQEDVSGTPALIFVPPPYTNDSAVLPFGAQVGWVGDITSDGIAEILASIQGTEHVIISE